MTIFFLFLIDYLFCSIKFKAIYQGLGLIGSQLNVVFKSQYLWKKLKENAI